MSPTPDRKVVTLSSAVAENVTRMGQQMGGASAPEVVRRGLVLLDLMLSAPDNEELVIHIKDTGTIVRLHFGWNETAAIDRDGLAESVLRKILQTAYVEVTDDHGVTVDALGVDLSPDDIAYLKELAPPGPPLYPPDDSNPLPQED